MYPYETRVHPPAPYLSIHVSDPKTNQSLRLVAKLDTGASMTVLPITAVTALALEPFAEIQASGYDRQTTLLLTYNVTVQVEGVIIQDVEVTATPRQNILLGRDILNHFSLTLDGKNLTFGLRDP